LTPTFRPQDRDDAASNRTPRSALSWAVGVSLPVLAGASGRELIAVLRNTGFFTLSWSILAAISLVIS